MSHHKMLEVRTEFCTHCNASTRWELVHRAGEDFYVCMGDDLRHPERHQHGCGSEVLAVKFLENHGLNRDQSHA